MEVYAQNSLFNVEGIFENFGSLIWTDRYMASGDFELLLPRGEDTYDLLNRTSYLSIPSSEETMVVESVEEEEHVKVTGRSLSSIMDRRICDVTSVAPSSNTLTAFLRYLVLHNMGALATIPERRVDFLNIDTTPPVDFVDPTVFDVVKYGDYLYDAVQKLCVSNSLGFTIRNRPGSVLMYFKLYYGEDKTNHTFQTVFSESIGNIQDVRRLKSDKAHKNVAVVNLPPWDSAAVGVGEIWRVNRFGVVPSGLDRREVWTDASELRRDETFNATNKPSRAVQWGYQTLVGFPKANEIDFKVVENSPYKYGVDYGLGDIVPVLDSLGEVIPHRVTEYIQSYGPEGSAEYPTLSAI